MGFENFGFNPERNFEGELTQSTESLADVLRQASPEERVLFGDLNRMANTYLEDRK